MSAILSIDRMEECLGQGLPSTEGGALVGDPTCECCLRKPPTRTHESRLASNFGLESLLDPVFGLHHGYWANNGEKGGERGRSDDFYVKSDQQRTASIVLLRIEWLLLYQLWI